MRRYVTSHAFHALTALFSASAMIFAIACAGADTAPESADPTAGAGGEPQAEDESLAEADDELAAVREHKADLGSAPTAQAKALGAMTAEDVAAGTYHTLYLRNDGTVWAWGRNNAGQLGDGSTSNASTPIQVAGLPNVKAVVAGGYHSLALDKDGKVWAWGQNTYGQLGNGNTTTQLTPIQIPALPSIKAIAGGFYHSMALDTNGQVWVWGSNSYGQLGLGTTGASQPMPVAVPLSPDVKEIAAGGYHSLAVKSDKQVWTWGRNNYGQIGNGAASTTNQTTPYLVPTPPAVSSVAGGLYHSLALLEDGTVMAWGFNSYGQLGLGNTVSPMPSPTPVPGLGGVTLITAGVYHSQALDSSGGVWSFGQNTYGQIGDGTTATKTSPTPVTTLSNVVGLAAGGYHAVALMQGSCAVWTWGQNAYGQLGDGSTTNQSTPNLSAAQRIFYFDGDMDGYGEIGSDTMLPPESDCSMPFGYVDKGGDCEDFDETISPAAAEICNGFDDNCSGEADEGNPEGGDVCSTGLPGVCAAGIQNCVGGMLVCEGDQAPGQQQEVCDGLDNDCNGSVDDSTIDDQQPCTVPGKLGLCAQGMTHCCDGAIECVQGNLPEDEICDGKDNDCDGEVDEGVKSTFYRDADNDGYGNPNDTAQACSPPPGYVANAFDCNDLSASIHPGATEQCNGKDDNCDGLTDEGVQSVFYRDADSDGYGNAGNSTMACSVPSGYVSNSSDCNDSNASIRPGATEVCDGVDNNCVNGIDEGVKSTFYRDADSDGYGNAGNTTQACSAPSGYVSNASDCNDSNASIRPGATEVCDGLDNNCVNGVDEGVKSTFYRDADGDGYGNAGNTTQACSAPSGYVSNASDCNDGNATVRPGATETCNNVDDNCNGVVDDNPTGTGSSCTVSGKKGVCANGSTACSNGSIICKQTNFGSTEICNDGLDNDCNGTVDSCVCTPGSTQFCHECTAYDPYCCLPGEPCPLKGGIPMSSAIMTPSCDPETGSCDNYVDPCCIEDTIGYKTCSADGSGWGPCEPN